MQDYFNAFKTISKRDDYIYVKGKKIYTQNRYVQLGVPCDLGIKEGAYPRKDIDKFLQGRSENFPESLEEEIKLFKEVEAKHVNNEIEKFNLLAKTSQSNGPRSRVYIKNGRAMMVDKGMLLHIPVDIPFNFVTDASICNAIAKLASKNFKIGFDVTEGTIKIFDTTITFLDRLLTYSKELDTMFRRNQFIDADGFETKNTDAKRVIKAFGGTKKSPTHKIARDGNIFKLICENGVQMFWVEKQKQEGDK